MILAPPASVPLALRAAGRDSFRYDVLREGATVGAVELTVEPGGIGRYRGALWGEPFDATFPARLEAALQSAHPELQTFYCARPPRALPGGGVTVFETRQPRAA